MFELSLLQAINDWQRGGDHKQKLKRGLALKAASATLPTKFRQCRDRCFRQEAHERGRTWQLLIDNKLPETIAAWTTSLSVAKNFKGGVPPTGLQGVVFEITPAPKQVVVNLNELFKDSAFQQAIAAHKTKIQGRADGLDRYGATQNEVVLELATLDLATVHSYGGYVGDLPSLVAEHVSMFGKLPTPMKLKELQTRAGKPWWLSRLETGAVISRVLSQAQAKRWIP